MVRRSRRFLSEDHNRVWLVIERKDSFFNYATHSFLLFWRTSSLASGFLSGGDHVVTREMKGCQKGP